MEPMLSITSWLQSKPRHISVNSCWKTRRPIHPEIPPSYLLKSDIPPLLGVPKPPPTFLRPPHHTPGCSNLWPTTTWHKSSSSSCKAAGAGCHLHS